MNKVLMSLLFGALLLTGSSFAQTPPPAADAPAAAAPETPKPVVHKEHKSEHHSELRKAIHKLRGAKADLEKAASDLGGHKAKAIESIDQALEELKSAVESDKK